MHNQSSHVRATVVSRKGPSLNILVCDGTVDWTTGRMMSPMNILRQSVYSRIGVISVKLKISVSNIACIMQMCGQLKIRDMVANPNHKT